jgi:2-dehydropantoate 2-reductase
MARVAVVGPGAIGGTVAAWLAQNPAHDIVVAARTPFDRLEVETPAGLLHAHPNVLTKPSEAAPVDWVLVATKAYDVEATAEWLERLLGEATWVAVLQNGVEHVERFAPYGPRDRIVPVVVDCSAVRLAPGRVRQRSPGRFTVPEGEPGRRFVDLFANAELEVAESADIQTDLWRKLCYNAPGALPAAVLAPTGMISRHAGVAEILAGIVRECVLVGRAEGADLDDAIVQRVMGGYRDAPIFAVNSMHADRLSGRPMEIDARNGVIVRLGKKHGIRTPLNAMLVAILESVAPRPD